MFLNILCPLLYTQCSVLIKSWSAWWLLGLKMEPKQSRQPIEYNSALFSLRLVHRSIKRQFVLAGKTFFCKSHDRGFENCQCENIFRFPFGVLKTSMLAHKRQLHGFRRKVMNMGRLTVMLCGRGGSTGGSLGAHLWVVLTLYPPPVLTRLPLTAPSMVLFSVHLMTWNTSWLQANCTQGYMYSKAFLSIEQMPVWIRRAEEVKRPSRRNRSDRQGADYWKGWESWEWYGDKDSDWGV